MKITAKKIRPYLNVIIGIAFLGAIAYAIIFLHDNFYSALNQTAEISTLQKNISAASVNVTEFNQLIENLHKKTTSSGQAGEITNPF
ncbi:MAG TPA: hypothetical protein VMD74_02015 [Candidatus Methylomirabilis sp.]|nr:hypothetical protein [Candidatus Methylomirabilis sp.]